MTYYYRNYPFNPAYSNRKQCKSSTAGTRIFIERLGTYHVTWSTGLHVKIPFIDKISKKVSLKEQVIDFPPQHGVNKTIPSCKS